MVTYLPAGAWVLVVLLVVANVVLRIAPLPLNTSERDELLELLQHSSPKQTLITARASVPDTTSETRPLPPTQATDQSAPEVVGAIERATHSEGRPLPPTQATDQSVPEVVGAIEPATHSEGGPLPPTQATDQSA